jgi:hypothetical protein
MIAVPVLIGTSNPVVTFTAATVVLLLVHVPPVLVLLSGVFTPVQTVAAPVVVPTAGATVTSAVRVHPLAIV